MSRRHWVTSFDITRARSTGSASQRRTVRPAKRRVRRSRNCRPTPRMDSSRGWKRTRSRMFLSHVLTRSARVEEDLVDQLFNSTEKRLARLALLLANFGKEGRPEPVAAKITQEMLAEMIGTTRSRVSHFMNKFRNLGFIEYNGSIKVH